MNGKRTSSTSESECSLSDKGCGAKSGDRAGAEGFAEASI